MLPEREVHIRRTLRDVTQCPAMEQFDSLVTSGVARPYDEVKHVGQSTLGRESIAPNH